MIEKVGKYYEYIEIGFRLLNSEIGNDHDDPIFEYENLLKDCFRLLNSEIGNDPKSHAFSRIDEILHGFSSP